MAGLEVLTDGLGRARIVVRGAPGGTSAGSSENVLVTLNGMRLNDGVFGGATAVNLDLPIDNVKRIEIVRGPGSVVNGPGAVLGVINIVTEGVDTFRRDELTLGAGSFKSFLYNYRYGTTFHDVSLAGFMEYSYTGGPELDVAADAQTGRDRDQAALGIRASSLAPGHTVDDRKSLDANLSMAYRRLIFHARLKKENAGGFVGLLDTLGRQNRFAPTQSNLSLEYRRDLRIGDLHARASYTDSRVTEVFDVYPPDFTLLRGPSRVFFPGGVLFQEELKSRRLGLDALLERRLAAHHSLTAGALLEHESTFGLRALTNFDFERQEPLPSFASVPSLVPDAGRTVASLYAQDAWNPPSRLGVTGGLRLDHYSDAGASLQPRLLDLVRSDSLDATGIYRRKDLRLAVSAYRTWLRDGIGPDVEGIVPVGRPAPTFRNFAGIDARGIDLEASRTLSGNRSVALVYSLQHAEDSASGRRLAGVPSQLGRLSATFGAGKYVILSPSLTVRGSRPRAAGDTRPDRDGYALFDLAARIHNFHPALELSAVVRDLFGTDYFDPAPRGGLPGDYPRPGRSLFIKAKYRF